MKFYTKEWYELMYSKAMMGVSILHPGYITPSLHKTMS